MNHSPSPHRQPMWISPEFFSAFTKAEWADIAYDLALRMTGNESPADAEKIIWQTAEIVEEARQGGEA